MDGPAHSAIRAVASALFVVALATAAAPALAQNPVSDILKPDGDAEGDAPKKPAAEEEATINYTNRAQEAEAFGDKGLAVQLEDMVRDEMGHSEETER